MAYNDFKSQICSLIAPGGTLKCAEDALEVYSRAYKATLTEALGETFEGVWSVLGDERFFDLALDYIRSVPSISFNLSDYGEIFPEFISTHRENKSFPFLKDLARFELIFKDLFHSSKPKIEQLSERFLSLDPDSKITFLPSMRLFKSKFSVYEIWQKRHDQESEVSETIFNPQFLMLYKGFDQKIWIIKLKCWQYDLIDFLQNGSSIEDALTKAIDLHQITEADSIGSFFRELGSYPIIAAS